MVAEDKRLILAWAPYSRRSQALADALDMELHLIHYLQFQRPLYALGKYVLQALHTLALLLRERPRIVFVQDPPIVASLVVYIYTVLVLCQARLVVDAHTGALTHPWWKPFRWLQKFLYRNALAVITTNHTLAERVESWGARPLTLVSPPMEIAPGKATSLSESFNLVLVNTFSVDEPLEAALEGVAQSPRTHLYVTGDVSKAPPSVLQTKPDNVTFTGFLPDQDYLELLRGADAIMALTSEDFTLQLGGMEAVAVGKPLITSDWSFLREHFDRGTVHVANTPQGIRQGIVEVQENLERLSAEILDLRSAQRGEWAAQSKQLHELVKRKTER